MNATYFFSAIAISAMFVVSCGKDTGGCFKGEKAKVLDYTDSDTCGILFQLVDDGTKLEPTNLAEYSYMNFAHGDLIWVSYKPTSGASLCGMGDIVEIKCVAEREY